MTIVLNEHEWAKDMIYARSLGKKPFETLSRVAKYYIDEGYSKKDTRQMLDTFLLQCDSTASLPKWSDTLDYAVSRALKYDAIQVDGIYISKSEMDKINSLDSAQIKRLAFTLLCLAKYWKLINPNSDYWVNNKDSEIMRMANINTSIKRQSLMYAQLNELGFIRFSKKIDNTNVRVCFVDEGEASVIVTDFVNLGYQYMMATGSKEYFRCQNCGVVVKKNITQDENETRRGRPQKYCNDCAVEVNMRKRVDSIMRCH